MRRYRKSTWGLVIWTVLMAAWAISGIGGGVAEADCANQMYTEACEAGTAVGAGIALMFVGGIWFVGFIVGTVIWFATRPRA